MIHPLNAVQQMALVSSNRKTYPELLAEQETLGRKILSDVKELSKKYDQKISLEIDENWRKFFRNYEGLRLVGIRDEKFFSEIEAAILQTRNKNTEKSALKDGNKLDEKKLQNSTSESHVQDKGNDKVVCFHENMKNFKELLYKKKAIVESYDYPDLILQELQLRFEILKEDAKNVSVKDDKKAQEKFDKVITLYFGILQQFRDQIQKKENVSALLTWPKSLETDMSLHSKNQSCGSLSITDQMQQLQCNDEKLVFHNLFDTLLDQPKLNSKNPENIRILLKNVITCLRSITKMGLNIETAKFLIARIIIRKFDKEILQQYECKMKKQKQTQKLEDMFDFLRQLIKQTQKDCEEKDSKIDKKSENIGQQEKNPQGNQTKVAKRRKRGKRGGKRSRRSRRSRGSRGRKRSRKANEANESNGISNNFGKVAINSVDKQTLTPSQKQLVVPMASAKGPPLAVKHEPLRTTFITNSNEVILLFKLSANTITRDDFFKIFYAMRDLFRICKIPLLACHKKGLFEVRLSTSPHPISKQKSAEILEMHIRNLRAGISLKAGYVGTIILNLHTPGLSEADIRAHYASSNTPETLKEFITPLLEKTGTLLHKIIIFPEDEQDNRNEALGG